MGKKHRRGDEAGKDAAGGSDENGQQSGLKKRRKHKHQSEQHQHQLAPAAEKPLNEGAAVNTTCATDTAGVHSQGAGKVKHLQQAEAAQEQTQHPPSLGQAPAAGKSEGVVAAGHKRKHKASEGAPGATIGPEESAGAVPKLKSKKKRKVATGVSNGLASAATESGAALLLQSPILAPPHAQHATATGKGKAAATAARAKQAPAQPSQGGTAQKGGAYQARGGGHTQAGQAMEDHEATFAAATERYSLSERQVEQLLIYLDYMLETNKSMNLTAVRDRSEARVRHLVDSLALLPVIDAALAAQLPKHATSVADLPQPSPRPAGTEAGAAVRLIDVGTGAGLPGMVLAAARPHWQVTLLDTLRKRCDFLKEAARRAGLQNVTVVWSRAEDGARKRDMRDTFTVAVARAVAEARTLAELCLPYVRPGGVWVAAKGPDPEVEVAAACTAIDKLGGSPAQLLRVDSYSEDGRRTALVVRKLRPTSPAYPRPSGTPNRNPL